MSASEPAVAPQPILVPLDGSELAERALRFAALLPARVLRLFACAPIELAAARARWARGEPPPDGGTWHVSSPADYLDLVGHPLRTGGRHVEAVVAAGKAGPAIVDASVDARLVVLTTRGQGLARLLLGSTSDYVVRNAAVPTLLIRDERPEPAAVLRVVVPLDGSAPAEEALPVAAALRHGTGAALPLVRVVDPGAWLASTSQLEREAATYLEGQAARLDGSSDGVTFEVRGPADGPATEQILAALRPGDLVVMTTHGRGGLTGRLLGSASSTVVERATVPVVLVRAAAGGMERSLARIGV
jgi:nucleotide-binding universal stress UspA family protein